MRAHSVLELTLLAALAGCAGSQGPVGSSVGEKDEAAEAAPSGGQDQGAGGEGGAGPEADQPASAESGPPPEPPPDPAVVQALVAKTGESIEHDNPLHVRLEVTPRPAGERWVVAVVNRGTEPASVLFDLRRLTLELEAPEDPKKPRPKWQKKPKPTLCKLPDGFGGALAQDEEPYRLEPGEGLVRTFDPRLYCISGAGDSLLKRGQTITPKLGFVPKPPRVIYRQGKRTEVPSLQSPPFVAEPAPPLAPADAAPAGDAARVAEPEPAPAAKAVAATPVKVDPENDPRVKELKASAFELTADLLGGEGEEDPSLPLALRLLRGSDVANERTATASVEVRAKGKKTSVYFRRELVSYTVHGPDGIRGCDPQPDDRAPDRQAYSSLAPGQAVSVTSMLAELCPNLTFGRPGLYLLSARFDATRDGSEFGLRAFTGRLESRRQALLRIRTGDLPPLPPAEPLRVRVGE
jgi:hypothetical protein